MDELKKALAEAQKANEEYKKAQAAADAEAKRLGHVTAELQTKVDKLNEHVISRMEAAQSHWDEAERKLNRLGALGLVDPKDTQALAKEAEAFNRKLALATGGRAKGFAPEDYKSFYKPAFKAWVLGGLGAVENMGPEFRAALTVGSDPAGGYQVPVDVQDRIVQFVYETSPMRQRAEVRTTKRDRIQIRRDLDRATLGGWTAETSVRSATSTPQVPVPVEIPVHEAWAFPLASQQDIDDADMDIEAWLASKLGERYAFDENTAFVTGSGTGKPRGFLTYPSGAPSKSNFNVIKQVKTGVNGGFAADPNGPDIFVDLMGEMKEKYLAGASWAMTRTTLAKARKLKDSYGHYQVQLSVGLDARPGFEILGFPVDRWADMPEIANGSLSIALANWKEAYIVLDHATGMKMLLDPFTQKPYLGLYSTKRAGGDVANTDAIKLALFSA
jgi:HK97 family phage major capsid protein